LRIPTTILTGQQTRPLWFDGRFLAARDLTAEQNYFLARQAELGRAGGFGVIHGLTVDQGPKPFTGETLVIHAGDGLTPSGRLVMISTDLTLQISDIADEENLEEQFGLSESPQQPQRTRTGLYVLALRPVEFTANPIASYPTNLSSPNLAHDGDIVEATAVSLIPYPNPVNTYDASAQQAAVARQIFVGGNGVGGDLAAASADVLPIAMVSLDRNVIQWIDVYMVRRDAGPQYSGVRFEVPDPATQQAFLLQYDAQLQNVAAARQTAGLGLSFSATDYFQAAPAAGRLPVAAIDTNAFTQLFFPQQTNVTLNVVPADELPALIEDSMSLPPIDLTLPVTSYTNLFIDVLIPVPRNKFAAFAAELSPTSLGPALPQTVPVRLPLTLLQLFPGRLTPVTPPPAGAWASAIDTQTYAFYVRRRSQPIFADFTVLPPPGDIVNEPPSFTSAPTTTPAPATTLPS
jgi:hypothetical protein